MAQDSLSALFQVHVQQGPLEGAIYNSTPQCIAWGEFKASKLGVTQLETGPQGRKLPWGDSQGQKL